MLPFMPAHTYFTSSFTILLTGISVLQKELAKSKKLNIYSKKQKAAYRHSL